MVAADDQVRAPVVLADDRVPDRLSRPGHAHRERQERKTRRARFVSRQDGLVAADTRVVVHVARLCHADDRVDEQVGVGVARSADRELLVCPMHRISSLERHDAGPSCAGEGRTHFRRRQAQFPIVVVDGKRETLDPATDQARVAPIEDGRGSGVLAITGSVHLLDFFRAVRLPHVVDVQHGEHDAFCVTQRDRAGRLRLRRERFGHVERDRNGPQAALWQPHRVADARVLGSRHEAAERRERAVQQELEIAELSRRKVPRRPVARM